MRTNNKLLSILILGFCSFLIIGCNAQSETTVPSATATQFVPTPIEPTATGTPTPLPPLIWLHTPQNVNMRLVEKIEAAISDVSEESGYRVERQSDLAALNTTVNVKYTILLNDQVDANEIIAASPEVRFISLGVTGIQPAPNLVRVGWEGERIDQQAFLAGYIAALITQDWRVGILSPADTIEGQIALQTFMNGVTFYCGLCRPVYPPYYDYPLFVQLPSTSSSQEWQVAADVFIQQSVRTVYFAPGVTDEALIDYLTQSGIRVILSQMPTDAATIFWAGTINANLEDALGNIWNSWKNDEKPDDQPWPITLIPGDSGIFSVGKQNVVFTLLDDLLSGYIDTGWNP